MQVVADVCVIPLKECDSLSEDIAVCQRLLAESQLSYNMHAYGTNIEGEWDEVMAIIKRFHETLHENGVVRISSNIKIGTRTDKAPSIKSKIESVQKLL